MKKLLILLSILFITGCTFNKEQKNNGISDYSNITLLNIEALKKKIDNKDSFILIVSRDDCSHCISYMPIANKVGVDYDIVFYDISLTGLSNEDQTYLRNIANVSGTPTTVFIINGEERSTDNRLVGEAKEYRLVEKLKAMGYINESNN